jgi:hypothetical protein
VREEECLARLAFTPPLDARVETLTLASPAAFGDGTVLRMTIALPRSD